MEKQIREGFWVARYSHYLCMDAKDGLSGGEKWNYLEGDQFKTSNKNSEKSRNRAPF